MIAAAHSAERHRQRTGRLWPGLGDGSLLSVALSRGRADPGCAGRDYRVCLAIVLERLAVEERATSET